MTLYIVYNIFIFIELAVKDELPIKLTNILFTFPIRFIIEHNTIKYNIAILTTSHISTCGVVLNLTLALVNLFLKFYIYKIKQTFIL